MIDLTSSPVKRSQSFEFLPESSSDMYSSIILMKIGKPRVKMTAIFIALSDPCGVAAVMVHPAKN